MIQQPGDQILFTGATGVIGRQTVPHLVAAGHGVKAVARSDDDSRWLTEVGAHPVEVDLFDHTDVGRVLDGIDVVIHMATSIPPQHKMTKRSSWKMNDRLRTDATRILVEGAMAHGISRFVQQSVSLVYADGGDSWIDEDAQIGPQWDVLQSALHAEREVNRFTRRGGTGVILRFSSLYGPGRTSDDYVAMVRDRKLPIVGRGDNYTSHLHIGDVPTAIEAALTIPAGTYNVSDDAPVTKGEELKCLAASISASMPRSIPRWIARSIVGPAAGLLSVSHRVSNERFKEAADWKPSFPSVLVGMPVIGSEHDQTRPSALCRVPEPQQN